MRSFFGFVLRGLDGLRKVLHLLLLLLIFGFVVGALRTSIPRLPAKAAGKNDDSPTITNHVGCVQ